jgi:hypothetical protein
MVNSVLRGAGRLANTMFGRSNSLSINTGAANSTLYASSPPLTSSSSLTSPPIHPTQSPRRSGPSLLGASVYSHKPTPGPSSLRNEWSDAPPDPSLSQDHRKQFTHGSKEAAQEATVAAFPHLDPNWTVPRRALALSLRPPETMCRILFLRLDRVSGLSQTMSRHLFLLSRQLLGLSQAVSQRLFLLSRSLSGISQAMPQLLILLSRSLSGLSQAMSRHLHMRQLSELSQTFCNVFRSGFKTTSSCHLHQLLELNQTMSCHLHIRPLHSLVRHQSFPTRRHRLTSQTRGRLRKKLAMDRGSTPLGAKQLLPKILSSIQISSYFRHRGCRHARKSDLCTKDGWSLTLQINSFDLI